MVETNAISERSFILKVHYDSVMLYFAMFIRPNFSSSGFPQTGKIEI